MKRRIDFIERITHNHSIIVDAESEELLDKIESSIDDAFIAGKVKDKEFLFETIESMGGDCTFVEDVSPDVEYE